MARVGAEVRRQDFIEAAVKVIAEYGVANATTRRIAAAANSPLASLHYVFHTKDELFDAVYESLIDKPQQSLLHVTAGATAADSVAEILRQLVGWFTTHPELATTQFELFSGICVTTPLWRARSTPIPSKRRSRPSNRSLARCWTRKRWPLSVACSSTCSMACFSPGPPMVTRSG